MNQLFTKLTAPLRRGFSLVEVLVAVMVLALGLLGLGAVFPAVLRQQRIATETTLGLSAQNAIAPILASNPSFKPGGRGWDALRQYVYDNDGVPRGDWVSVIPEDRKTEHLGSYILQAADWDTNDTDVYLPLSQRLYPLPYSTGKEPRFVWDFVARLIDPDNPETSPLLVAVFLRPIDPGIRTETHIENEVAVADSLTRAFLDNSLPNRARRNPISVDPSGRPVLDGRRGGRGKYAMPIVATVTGPGIDPDKRDELYLQDVLSPGTKLDVARRLLELPGQQFLDSQGNIYTVTEVIPIAGQDRKVAFTPDIDGNDSNNDGRFDDLDYNPIVYLPLGAPVKPDVFIINP